MGHFCNDKITGTSSNMFGCRRQRIPIKYILECISKLRHGFATIASFDGERGLLFLYHIYSTFGVLYDNCGTIAPGYCVGLLVMLFGCSAIITWDLFPHKGSFLSFFH